MLFIAVENKNVEIANLLISNEKIDINCKYTHRKEYVRYSNNGTYTETESEEKTAFYNAIEKNNSEIVQLFLSNKKTDVNSKYKYQYYERDGRYHDRSKNKNIPAFYCSVQNGNTEIVNFLLSHPNIDVNSKYNDYDGSHDYKYTPLQYAVSQNNFEMINTLISYPKIDEKYKIEQENVQMKYKNFLKYLFN